MIHIPVMLNEFLSIARPTPSKHFLDCTFGRGGHTKAILSFGAQVTAIDRDPDAYCYGKMFEFSRFKIFQARFSSIDSFKNIKFDGILFDFGLSSNQIQDSKRGMSFKVDGPLDMRMGLNSQSAKDCINSISESELSDLIYKYGDEWNSRKIAKAIVTERRRKKIETTLQLAKIVRANTRAGCIDGATKTFQAIRIHVNDELSEIEMGLEKAVKIASGPIVAISFHSLEDRIVKNFCKKMGSKRKPISPGYEEIRENRRSRSAKMRFLDLSS